MAMLSHCLFYKPAYSISLGGIADGLADGYQKSSFRSFGWQRLGVKNTQGVIATALENFCDLFLRTQQGPLGQSVWLCHVPVHVRIKLPVAYGLFAAFC